MPRAELKKALQARAKSPRFIANMGDFNAAVKKCLEKQSESGINSSAAPSQLSTIHREWKRRSTTLGAVGKKLTSI